MTPDPNRSLWQPEAQSGNRCTGVSRKKQRAQAFLCLTSLKFHPCCACTVSLLQGGGTLRQSRGVPGHRRLLPSRSDPLPQPPLSRELNPWNKPTSGRRGSLSLRPGIWQPGAIAPSTYQPSEPRAPRSAVPGAAASFTQGLKPAPLIFTPATLSPSGFLSNI